METIMKDLPGAKTMPSDHKEVSFFKTHLPLDIMDVILADDIFNCIFLNKNDRTPIHISLKYVPGYPIDNKPALVQVMAWRRTGDKPLPGSRMAQFIDAYRGRWAEKLNVWSYFELMPL